MGEKLRKARKRANITQEEMAELLGVDRSTISKYEHNATVITALQLRIWCKACNVSSDYILGLDDEGKTFMVQITDE